MKSHHLDWLARKAKDILLPHLVFVESLEDGNSACCYRPYKGEMQVGNVFVPFDKGLILVSESQMKFGSLENTLAHEWRHHWQWFNFPRAGYSTKFNADATNYKDAIIKFFKDPKEYDALVFSHKVAPDRTSRTWIAWIQEYRLLQRQIVV